ncbi:MAG: 23S rRNA (pseudouridine(1915)-N(3))-methyltransferase RlmH [Bdellovibrionaceae bacterium]|nr:23S rRNA (pseudouridine(1915)-N(3))-methyltransferase RlmH [Pseudobdellovibrionaceae bacterium]
MKVVLLNFQTSKESWFQTANETYSEKISHFTSFEIKTLRTQANERDQKDIRIKKEGQAVLDLLKPEDFLVLLDEKGQALTSMKFSEHLNRILNSGKKQVYFLIGGPYGVSDEIKMRASLKINLSPFTLNHLVAQVVLLEQIYRGFTILKNLPYHNP